MRFRNLLLAALALLVAPATAFASDPFSSGEEASSGQGAEDGLDLGGLKFKIIAGLYGASSSMRLKVTGITSLNFNGNAIYPNTVARATSDVLYFTNLSVQALEAGAETSLPMGIRAGVCLRLGATTLGITQEIGPDSLIGGTVNETALSRDRVFFGMNLNASYDLQKFRVTAAWDFFVATGKFDNQIFMNCIVDGWYKAIVNRIGVEASYDLDFIRPFIGAGLLFHTGFADLTESDDITPRTYKVRLAAHNPFVCGLGAVYFAEKHVYVRFEATFVSEMTFEATLGAAFG